MDTGISLGIVFWYISRHEFRRVGQLSANSQWIIYKPFSKKRARNTDWNLLFYQPSQRKLTAQIKMSTERTSYVSCLFMLLSVLLVVHVVCGQDDQENIKPGKGKLNCNIYHCIHCHLSVMTLTCLTTQDIIFSHEEKKNSLNPIKAKDHHEFLFSFLTVMLFI